MITRKDVSYIASLARLHLDEGELDKLTHNLEDILGYVEKLNKLDVSQVEPTSHAMPLNNVYREDVIQPSLTQDTALRNAPEQHHGAFKVPQVIE